MARTKGCCELICEGELLEASGEIDDMAVDNRHKQWLGCSEWPLGEAPPQDGGAALEQVTKRGQGLWRGFKTWLDKARDDLR